MVGAPVDDGLRRELRPVVDANRRRTAVHRHQRVEFPHNPTAGPRQPDRALERLLIPLVEHRQQAHAVRHAPRRAARQIQPQRAVHAMHHSWIQVRPSVRRQSKSLQKPQRGKRRTTSVSAAITAHPADLPELEGGNTPSATASPRDRYAVPSTDAR